MAVLGPPSSQLMAACRSRSLSEELFVRFVYMSWSLLHISVFPFIFVDVIAQLHTDRVCVTRGSASSKSAIKEKV